MKHLLPRSLVLAIAGLLFCVHVQVEGQSPNETTPRWSAAGDLLPPPGYAPTDADIQLVSARKAWSENCRRCSGEGCRQCCSSSPCGLSDPGLYAGAEFLLVRPHFSEAIAFAQGIQTPTSLQTRGRELQFDYDPSLRFFMGYRFTGGGELRFTYWCADSDISVEGTPAAGEFFVDPFGSVVGAVAVIDPSDARFGTVLVGGDLIRTRATVQTNVYDLDWIKPTLVRYPNWVLNWSAGVRIADIDQYYESVITSGGAFFSRGDFVVDFIGAGPRLGLEARRHFGAQGRFSLFVSGHGALLLGEDVIRFTNAPNAVFVATQEKSLTRTLPVMEAELGASWQIGNSLGLSAGWSFQAWFDMGTSGGQFGGYLAGADDSNVMSFDAMFLRAEWTF